ncbi:MAG: glutathione S-transferase family protein [Janthinobacterium lividum]
MGVDIERINVDLFKGESHTPEFLKLNPPRPDAGASGRRYRHLGGVGDQPLSRRKTSPDSNLLGRTEAERFKILQWMFWSGEQWRVFSTILFNEWAGKTLAGKPPTDAVVELAMSNIRNAAMVLDAHLASRKFIVGDALTLADIDIAAPFSQYQRTGAPFNEFPNLMAWQQRLLDTVPAWAATRDEVEARMSGVLDDLG